MSAADDWTEADAEWVAISMNVRRVGDAELASVIAQIKELRRLYAMLRLLDSRQACVFANGSISPDASQLETDIGPRRYLHPGALYVWKQNVRYLLTLWGQQFDY